MQKIQASEKADKADDELKALANMLERFKPAAAFNPSFAGAHPNAHGGVRQRHVARSQPRMAFSWPWEKKDEDTAAAASPAPAPAPAPKKLSPTDQTDFRAKEVLKLTEIGASPSTKALQVNLDTSTYGSFAEIGAGQEVSRTFLQAGAAAGTVAKSLSAYDMQMSDALYGTAKRYVTLERATQMAEGEYKDLEAYVREGKAAWGGRAPDVKFFSFASTLAAKAYMSDRECEGWIALKYQHESFAEPSLITIHVRMTDPTAQLQGEAIGVLGTNLVYLTTKTTDPYAIATFLLDGLDEGRLEVDYINFEGPGFPAGSFDPRILALRQIQFGLATAVMLAVDEKTGQYTQVVPNDYLYKSPVIVQRSRFFPVTCTHIELMNSAERKYAAGAAEGDRAAKCVYQMQVDDLKFPANLRGQIGRNKRIAKLIEADSDKDGFISIEEMKNLLGDSMTTEEFNKLMADLDKENKGFVEIDALVSLSKRSLLATSFNDRFDMLAPLKVPVLVSAIDRNDELASYLARYTKQQVTVVVGGGDYSIERGLYNPTKYDALDGGLLEAFGKLFSNNVKIYQYPNIRTDGTVVAPVEPVGSAGLLHQYLVKEGNLLPISDDDMSKEALDASTNKAFTGGAKEIGESIEAGDNEWETYVTPEVAEIVKKARWYNSVKSGEKLNAEAVFTLNEKVQ